jgi:hypothetical protein
MKSKDFVTEMSAGATGAGAIGVVSAALPQPKPKKRKKVREAGKYPFAGQPEQKPGDQVRGTEKARKRGNKHPFQGRLVGGAAESTDLSSQLAWQFLSFLKEDGIPPIPAPGAATVPAAAPGAAPSTAANTQANTSAVTNNVQAMKDQQALTKNLAQLKTINPQINPAKLATAITKDPRTLTPADARSLGVIAQTIKPAINNMGSLNQLKGAVTRAIPKV